MMNILLYCFILNLSLVNPPPGASKLKNSKENVLLNNSCWIQKIWVTNNTSYIIRSNHKNRTILLLSYSCDDSSKCDFNFSRHTLVDKRVFWIWCICWINKDTHLLCYIQCLLAFECHSCVCGTEQFLSVWIYKNLNLGNTKLLFEESNTDGRQIICHDE